MVENQLVSFSLVFLVAIAFVGQAHGIDVCRGAEYIPLCQSVVKGVTDPRVALKIAIEHLLFETKRAKLGSVVLVHKEAIEDCNSLYDAAISSLESGLEDLKRKDKTEVEFAVSATISHYGSCSDTVAEYRTFGDVKLKPTLKITDTDATLQHLASNCLHIASLLK